MDILHIDIETFSEADLKTVGAHRYAEDPTTEILLIGYAVNDEHVRVIDMDLIRRRREIGAPDSAEELELNLFKGVFFDHDVVKVAHNAAFERTVFNAKGFATPVEEWRCSSVAAAYAGWPMKLEDLSKAMDLKNGKLDTGKQLITLFSCPCKPTRINKWTRRNLPSCYPEKWEKFKEYNMYDVLAEREIWDRLAEHMPSDREWSLYHIDQHINDLGVYADTEFAECAIALEEAYRAEAENNGGETLNLRSVPAMKKYIYDNTGIRIESLNKDAMPDVLAKLEDYPDVVETLTRRSLLSKTSPRKYGVMLSSVCGDARVKGTLQFYGAGRTGRWAGRRLQMQNLPQNHIDDLDGARAAVMTRDPETVSLLYGKPLDILSQLIRTAVIAPEGKTLCVADYSAIEARVTAWLAGEEWVLDVFRDGGDIYCSTASKMFGVPVVNHGVNGHLRPKGKVAVLALGYGGGTAALERMGGSRMGLSAMEMEDIKNKWRKSNPSIVKLWRDIENAAVSAIETGKWRSLPCMVSFHYDGTYLKVVLPSARTLHYARPRLEGGRLTYEGMDQVTKRWSRTDTYGGKLTENIVQAVARDLLANAIRLIHSDDDFRIVAHVHDEIIAEIDETRKDELFQRMVGYMCDAPEWADGLPLNAAGFTSKYYKKD